MKPYAGPAFKIIAAAADGKRMIGLTCIVKGAAIPVIGQGKVDRIGLVALDIGVDILVAVGLGRRGADIDIGGISRWR